MGENGEKAAAVPPLGEKLPDGDCASGPVVLMLDG